MRVGVIRGDLPGPLFVADLVPTSQSDKPVDGPGQTRYLSRPNPVTLGNYLTAQGLSASASALITATVPVGGPVNVSSGTITGVSGLSSATGTQVAALQDLLAPHIWEDYWALQSFEVGQLAKMQAADFNPNSRATPPISNGPAIAVVNDDGSTAFTATLPVLGSAVLSGSITLTGTFMANSEDYFATTIYLSGNLKVKITGKQILTTAGGVLTATSIVIPASLVPAAATTGLTTARVLYAGEFSNLVTM